MSSSLPLLTTDPILGKKLSLIKILTKILPAAFIFSYACLKNLDGTKPLKVAVTDMRYFA